MRLFISYSHTNRSKVKELQKLLEKAGNQVWFDEELIGAELWWQRILDEIEQTEVFIFALSPEATESAFCRAEFQYALDLNKPILPIMLKQAELPIGRLQETQYLDARKLNSSDIVFALTRSLLNLQKALSTGAYPAPDPLPPRPKLPTEADPLKDIREKVKNLATASEEEVVALVFRIKQVARLSNKTSNESRQLLQSIMTSPHIPHGVALEARDALAMLPKEKRLPWIYGVSALLVMAVVAVAVVLLSNRQPAATILPTRSATTPATSVPPTLVSPPAPRLLQAVSDRSPITPQNAAQLAAWKTLGRGNSTRVSWSPDGKTIAVSTSAGYVWLYNPDNPQEQPRLLEGHTHWAEPVVFSPDSKILASGSSDATIRLWDVNTAQPIGDPITGYSSWVRALAFSPDGKTLISGGCWDVRFWDIGDRKHPTPLGKPIRIDGSCINAIALNPAGTSLAISYSKGKIAILDTKTREFRDLPVSHSDYAFGLTFSPDGKLLASSSWDKTVRLWDVKTMSASGDALTGFTSLIDRIVFTQGGSQLVTGTGDDTIRIWNIQDHKIISSSIKTSVDIDDFAISPDGNRIAIIAEDGSLSFWSLANNSPIAKSIPLFNGYGLSIDFDLTGENVAAGYNGSRILLWNINTEKSQDGAVHTEVSTPHVAFHPLDSNILASGAADGMIRLWNVSKSIENANPLERAQGADKCGCINTIAFSPDGLKIAAGFGGNDDRIHIWNFGTGTEQSPLSGNQDDVLSMAFNPSGNLLAAGYKKNAVILWDLQTNAPLFDAPLSGHADAVNTVAFHPNGKYMASGSSDKTIRIWDVLTGKLVKQLGDQSGRIQSIIFSPDGSLMASGSRSNDLIYLWDVRDIQNPKVVQTLKETAGVYALAFSSDGTLLASFGDSGVIRLWSIPKAA
jgi:WD40 repeat protein